MTPTIQHIQTLFPELIHSEMEQPNLSVSEQCRALGASWYGKLNGLSEEHYKEILPLRLVLNVEYDLLGRKLHAELDAELDLDKFLERSDEIKNQLIALFKLSKLLQYLCQHYLIIPSEVENLRTQRRMYRALYHKLLAAKDDTVDADEWKKRKEFQSVTQRVLATTVSMNLYRLLILRSKRALDFVARVETCIPSYRNFMTTMGKYVNPIVAHLGWTFFLPRLLINLYSLVIHTIPGFWMGQKEKDLGWFLRLKEQMKLRGADFGNDVVWVSAGFATCFYLTGVLAPIGVYLTLACFAYDVIAAIIRAGVELNRLYELREHYKRMKGDATGQELVQVEEHLKAIDNQIELDQKQLGARVIINSIIFLAMFSAVPFLVLNPIIPAIAAVCLIAVCLTNFSLRWSMDRKQPKNITRVEADKLDSLKFFAQEGPAKYKQLRELRDSSLLSVPQGELSNSLCAPL